MTDRAHRNTIVNLKDFLSRSTKSQKKNPFIETDGSDGASGRELRLDVLATIRYGLNPAIRFFNHATDSRKIAAIRSSASVLMPSRETVLITGKTLPLRSTPPVAVSDSAAVSSARKAIAIASSSLR